MEQHRTVKAADSERQLSYQEIARRENLRSVIERLPQAVVDKPKHTSPLKPKSRTTRKPNRPAAANQETESSQNEIKQKDSEENFRKFNAFAATYGYTDTKSLVQDVKENYSPTEDESQPQSQLPPPAAEGKKREYVSDWVTSTVSASTQSDESVKEDEVMKSIHEAEIKAIAEGTVQPEEDVRSTSSNQAVGDTRSRSSPSETGSLPSTQEQLAAEYQKQLDDCDDKGRDSSLGTSVQDEVHDATDGRERITGSAEDVTGDNPDATKLPTIEKMNSANDLDHQVVGWLEELGNGKYGSVVYQIELQDGKVAAARKVKGQNVAEEDVNTLKTLSHPCIMVVYGLIHHNGHIFMVLEYMKYGSLRKYLDDGTLSSNKVCMSLVIQVASGIAYLHNRDIVHGDIGAHNCFLMSDDKIKVRILHLDSHSNKDVDAMMFGDLLCEVLFPHQHAESTQEGGATARPDIPSDCPAGLRELIQACWGEGSHALTMEDIKEKLETHGGEVKKQNDWKNLDEPIQYQNELQGKCHVYIMAWKYFPV